MGKFQIDQTQVDAVLAELEGELAPILKAAQEGAVARLAKSNGLEASASPGPGEGSASAPPSAIGAAGAPGAPAAPGADAPPPGSPDASAPGAEPSPGEGADGGGDITDPAALEAEYEKLPPELLKLHYLAAKQALMKVMGSQAGGAPQGPGSAPPAGPAGAPPPGPSAAPAFKSETQALLEHLAKNERTIASQDTQIAQLATALGLLLKPERKAVTGVSYVAKTEPKAGEAVDVSALSKAEITARLKAKTADVSKLSKADRDAIGAYYTDRIGVEGIAHLLQ